MPTIGPPGFPGPEDPPRGGCWRAAAEAEGRSMNAEIVAALEARFPAPEAAADHGRAEAERALEVLRRYLARADRPSG